jgi:hypothetical protein
MKKLAKIAIGAAMIVLGSGCVSKTSHHVDSSDSVQGAEVVGQASGVGFLHLTAPNLDASSVLKGKCSSGKLSNVETQSQMRDVSIVQLYSVDVRAICNPLGRVRPLARQALVGAISILLVEHPSWAEGRQVFGTSNQAPKLRDLAGADAGAFRFQRWGEAPTSWGVEMHLITQGFETSRGAFYFGGFSRDGLRIWGRHGVSIERSGTMRTGVRLGPARFEVNVGSILFSVDRLSGGTSAQLFSPRVGLGAGLALPGGGLLIAAAESEYVWRWFGPDYRVFDVHLSLMLPVARTWGPG